MVNNQSCGYLIDLTSGFVQYREANGTGMLSLWFTRIYIRVGTGTVMGVHGYAIGYCSARKSVSGSGLYSAEPMGSHN